MGDLRCARADHDRRRRQRRGCARSGCDEPTQRSGVSRRAGARPGAGDKRQPRARVRRPRPGVGPLRRRRRAGHRRARAQCRRRRRGCGERPAQRAPPGREVDARNVSGCSAAQPARPRGGLREPDPARPRSRLVGRRDRRRRDRRRVAWSSAATERLDDAAVLALAATLEGHPDNVAACLRGGLDRSPGRDDGWRAQSISVPVASTLAPVAFVPGASSSTKAARELLPESVPHDDAAATPAGPRCSSRRCAAQPELLMAATEDACISPTVPPRCRAAPPCWPSCAPPGCLP